MKNRLKLEEKKCVPCIGGIQPMKKDDALKYLKSLNGWDIVNNKKIKKSFKFSNFKETMDFVNKVADTAEHEGHHPDICLYYGKADITLWTHKIKGLHENDFIMAAKIDRIAKSFYMG